MPAMTQTDAKISPSQSVPLVLVHGYMGGTAQWDLQASLAERYHLIPIALPGFGDNHHAPSPDKIADFAAYCLSQLSALGVTQFHLLGHSMGGMIVQEMMVQEPTRIKKFILYGTAATGNLPDRFETFATSKNRVIEDGVIPTARRISATWFRDYEASESYEACADIAVQSSQEAMLNSLDAMQSWDRQDKLTAITSPTLIIWGEADRTYHWPQIHQLWSQIPEAHLAVMPFCSHAAHMENPSLFNQIVSDFLVRD